MDCVFEITSSGALEPTYIKARDSSDLLNRLNLAAAEGKHFLLAEDTEDRTVLLEIRNITRAREFKPGEAFI